ncbi:uncharacterized protein METZ01_LOCUS326942, partial [marine metagenome]
SGDLHIFPRHTKLISAILLISEIDLVSDYV